MPLLDPVFHKIRDYGWIGVDLFLCLSAFLISKLLLIEHERFRTISTARFLLRRLLRIWPLYYLSVIIGFLLLPIVGFQTPHVGTDAFESLVNQHFLSYLVFLGNWTVAIGGYAPSPMLIHLWTISLEEQFYVAWPFVLKRAAAASKQAILRWAAAILCIALIARMIAWQMELPHPFVWVCTITRLDPIIAGTLLAFTPEKTLREVGQKFRSSWTLITAVALLALVTLAPNIDRMSWHIVWQYPAVAICSALLLVSALYNRTLSRILSARAVVSVGKISYGCYVYHVLMQAAVWRVLTKFSVDAYLNPMLTYWTQFVLSLFATIAVSFVSYRFFETRWLVLKDRFTAVASRPV